MKPVFQVTLCISLLAAALPAAALAAEEFSHAGLIFWLKQDAGITKDAANKITAWQDQSGAGNHATGEAATAPVFTTEGGLSFARFNAAAKTVLKISKPISATSFTVVAAIRFGVAPSPSFMFWLGGDNGQGCYAGGGAHWQGAGMAPDALADGWGMFRGTAQDYPWLVTNAAAPTDLGVISITNKHLYRNMLDVGLPFPFQTLPYAFKPNHTNANPFNMQMFMPGIEFTFLGSNSASGQQHFTGDIFEVLVFNQSLTTGERVKVESYLMSRYNVAKPAYSPGVGPPTSGLALWLKADAGITKDGANKITAWQDQSGKARHATNADAATAPVFTTEGGRSFARFDKTNWLNCAVSAEKYTVFAAIRIKYPCIAPATWDGHFPANVYWFGGDDHGLVGGGEGASDRGWGIQFGTLEGGNSWPARQGDRGRFQTMTIDKDFVVTTVNNYGLWRNGRSDMDYEHSGAEAIGQVDYLSPWEWSVPAINLTRLGGLPNAKMKHDADFNGDIAEVLIYDRLLLEPERGMVEDYLMTKYSIAAPPVRTSQQHSHKK